MTAFLCHVWELYGRVVRVLWVRLCAYATEVSSLLHMRRVQVECVQDASVGLKGMRSHESLQQLGYSGIAHTSVWSHWHRPAEWCAAGAHMTRRLFL